jgi:hypothetical protein
MLVSRDKGQNRVEGNLCRNHREKFDSVTDDSVKAGFRDNKDATAGSTAPPAGAPWPAGGRRNWGRTLAPIFSAICPNVTSNWSRSRQSSSSFTRPAKRTRERHGIELIGQEATHDPAFR